ncbi:MAG: lipid II flippase MurJ, partial [Verrucomicrobiia bacterium]
MAQTDSSNVPPDKDHKPTGCKEISTRTSPPRGIARSAGVVSLAVSISRVLGLVREQVIASLFGADMRTDAFQTAFRAPNLLRDLFAEGALSTAFVTTFSKKIALEGDAQAWRLANKVATLTAVWMSGITLCGILF